MPSDTTTTPTATAILQLKRSMGPKPARLIIQAHEAPFAAFTDLPTSVRADDSSSWLSAQFDMFSIDLPKHEDES